MKIHLCFILIFFSMVASAQTYLVSTIPDSLKKNADVVTRYEERIFEIKSPGKAIEHEKRVYTILNESGDYCGRYRSYYDKFTSINSISGTLYDAQGKELKRVKKKDMQDVSGTGDESLMTDTRYKINDFYNRSYPYTVCYEEEDEINGLLEISDWLPQGINKASVEYSKYVIIAPKDYQLRYKPVNCSMEPVITEEAGKKIYTWEMKNLPARTAEVLSPAWKKILPFVMVAPSDFEAEGYKGNMSSWENYGRFIYELLKGRDQLTYDVKKQVHLLTDNLKTPKEKIALLYDYLQKNTRYISIQLGIGGLQPFDAAFVSTKRYGDCKALSNFMVALLKEAGIKGNSVIIKSGEGNRYMNDNFPSDQFDHVISCVPMGKDTVWLECTSQTLPAGYLSSFTSDRYGLLIDENGGKLVHTPKYGLDQNLQARKIDATVNEEGNLTINVHTRYRAEQQDDLEQYINGLSRDKLMEYLKSEIELPTYDVVKFNYTQDKAVIPDIDESLNLEATNYAQVSGRRLFIVPDILTRSQMKLKPDENRKYAIELKEEYREVDSVEIKIPKGYQPEAVQKDMNLESRFGKYNTTTKVLPDKVVYYRLFEQYSGNFPASSYADLAKFYEQVYKADRSKVVLIKTE